MQAPHRALSHLTGMPLVPQWWGHDDDLWKGDSKELYHSYLDAFRAACGPKPAG